jgi:DNA topoisomerase IA
MEQLESLFDDESILRLKTSEIRDLGYKQVTDPDETIEKDILDEGEGVLFVKKRVSESLRPDLLSERDLLKEMINSNLGTDATRPETIQNIQQWNFCEKLQDKLVLSELGEKILIASMETAEVITKPDLTRTLESEISKIRQQQEHPERVLENAFTVVREIIESVNLRNLVHMLQFEKCPKCGGITGLSRYGPDEPIRVKCSGKNCRYSRLLG